jgi:phage-related protein
MADYTVKIDAKDNASGTINKISGGLGGLTAGAGKFKAALGVAAGALAALGAVSVIGNKINEFDDLAKAARTAGAAASNEAFQGFQVMKQAMNEAGIDAATFDRAMLQTTSRLKAGTEGQKSFAKITDKLGDSLLDMNGNLKSGPELLKEMMNALNAGTITTEEFAKVVGGRAGHLIQQQFASLNTSAEALEGTLADVAANSQIVDLDAAKNAEVFNDNIGRLKEGMGQLLTDAITPLLPHLVKLSEDIMANMPIVIEKVQNAFTKLEPVFNLIGTVLSELVFPILSKVFGVLGTIAEAISPLVESAIPGLKMAFDALVKVVESIVGFFTGVAESLQGIYDKAIQLKDGVTGTFSNMADSVKDTTADMTDKVTGFFGNMYQKVVGGSIVPDMVDGVIAEFKRQATNVNQISGSMTNSVTEDFQKMSDASMDFAEKFNTDFNKTLADGLANGNLSFDSFAGLWKNTLSSLLQDTFNGGNQLSSIFGTLFGGGGGLGGGLSGIVSGISSFFGGFFADGGRLGAGKFGIAGEAGPELITGPANITPMDQIGGGGPAVNITIQAIDTQTGTEFLLKNKKQVEGIIQNAFNRRGKQGIY